MMSQSNHEYDPIQLVHTLTLFLLFFIPGFYHVLNPELVQNTVDIFQKTKTVSVSIVTQRRQ